MSGFAPVGSFPVVSTGGPDVPGPAALTITGATPATSYISTPTYYTPTYVAAGSVAAATAGSTVAVPYPASGILNGNFAVIQASVHTNSASSVLSAPAGWTRFFNAIPDVAISHAAFYRVLDGTESGTVTLTSSGGILGAFVGVMHIWTNVDATTPFEGSATGSFNSGHGGSTQSMTGSSVTSLGVQRKFANFYTVVDTGNAVSSPTPGSGWTDDLNSFAQYNTFSYHGFVVDEDATVAPLPTTHAAESRTQTGQTYAFVSLALIPATTRATGFNPSAANLALSGQTSAVVFGSVLSPAPAALVLSGFLIFEPAPANLAIFGNTPSVIFPGASDDVVVAYVW